MICELLGISKNNIPQDGSMEVLIQTIKRSKAGYGLNELLLAFQMKVDKELIFEKDHFHSLDSEYFNDVIHAYKLQKRNPTITEHNDLMRKAELPEKASNKDLEYRRKENFEWIVNYYSKNKSFPTGAKYSLAFDYAQNNDIFFVSKEEGKEIKSYIVKKLQSDLLKHKKEGNKLALATTESILKNNESIKIECKVYYMKKWIKENY